MSTAKKTLTTCKPKTAVAYARYSSAQQRDVSIEQQLKDIRDFAAREGYTIIHEYADHAKSGFKNSERREEFQAMLMAAHSGAFDTVIAWKVDRFGRDRRESAMFKGQLADNGVSVVYAMEPIPDGAAGCLTEGMLEAIAEWYSRNLSENIRRGQNDNAQKCISNGIKIFGFSKGPDDHYVINEPEAAVVRRIFTLYSQGNSATAIARILEADGIRTNRGIPFSKSAVTYIIQNDTYHGVYKFGNVKTPGGMPVLIDDDLWEVCQNLRTKTKRTNTKGSIDYFLSGKCVCGLCGGRIIGNYTTGTRGKGKYIYYACRNKKMSTKLCPLPLKDKEEAEKKVFDFLLKKVLSGQTLEKFIDCVTDALAAQQERSPLRKLELELKDVNRRINNITMAISEGVWSKQTTAMLEDLNNRADELQQKILYQHATDHYTVSKDRIRFYLHKIAEGKRNDAEYLHTIVNTFINSITFYEDYLRIVVNAAENVGTVPPEKLPPIDQIPEFESFALRPNDSSRLVTVQPYPVIVFKIAV